MSDEASALVGRFMQMLRQAGCRGTPARGEAAGSGRLAHRDLAEIAVGAEALPGNWCVETKEVEDGGAGRALVYPQGNGALPTFAFLRRDGFITVRMMRPDSGRTAGSLVFGVFASVVAAFDAIHNDVLARQARISRMLMSVA